MTRPSSNDTVVTPEAVALAVDVAGLGSRMIAATIDTAIQLAIGGVALLVFIPAFAALNVSETTAVVSLFVVTFFLTWGYYPFCEGLFHGVTPGKRAQRLRVIQSDGQPAKLGAILVRNLLRIVDFLPAWYAIGTITMIFSKRSQRVGDMIAGTIVVRDRRAPAPVVLPAWEPQPAPLAGASSIDVSALGEREYALVRSFLQRRDTLDLHARTELARTIAATIRSRIAAADTDVENELFLERIAAAYRARFTDPSTREA